MSEKSNTWLVKVPAITAIFWVIKVLSTTVGETVADAINTWFTSNLGVSDINASLVVTAIMAVLLIAALVWQLSSKRYYPFRYWLVAVLISVVGTLVTDDLHDGFGVELWLETAVFGAALILVFAIWYAKEKTLAMKSINTPAREIFYWVAILFTFALGTAVGDWMSEALNLGYLFSFLIFTTLILLVAALWKTSVLSSVATFWTVYILTRPLGASLGDLLSQNHRHGGLQFGVNKVSLVFLVLIVAGITYLTRTRKDELTV